MTQFADLSFKLLVVEQLMYHDKVLTPLFDPAAYLRERGIADPDGYAWREEHFARILPECREYFDGLAIPDELLRGVTGLVADGGNVAFLAAAPSWDGEDDLFDVRDLADLDLVPNLREVDAEPGWFPDGTETVFAARGIMLRNGFRGPLADPPREPLAPGPVADAVRARLAAIYGRRPDSYRTDTGLTVVDLGNHWLILATAGPALSLRWRRNPSDQAPPQRALDLVTTWQRRLSDTPDPLVTTGWPEPALATLVVTDDALFGAAVRQLVLLYPDEAHAHRHWSATETLRAVLAGNPLWTVDGERRSAYDDPKARQLVDAGLARLGAPPVTATVPEPTSPKVAEPPHRPDLSEQELQEQLSHATTPEIAVRRDRILHVALSAEDLETLPSALLRSVGRGWAFRLEGKRGGRVLFLPGAGGHTNLAPVVRRMLADAPDVKRVGKYSASSIPDNGIWTANDYAVTLDARTLDEIRDGVPTGQPLVTFPDLAFHRDTLPPTNGPEEPPFVRLGDLDAVRDHITDTLVAEVTRHWPYPEPWREAVAELAVERIYVVLGRIGSAAHSMAARLEGPARDHWQRLRELTGGEWTTLRISLTPNGPAQFEYGDRITVPATLGNGPTSHDGPLTEPPPADWTLFPPDAAPPTFLMVRNDLRMFPRTTRPLPAWLADLVSAKEPELLQQPPAVDVSAVPWPTGLGHLAANPGWMVLAHEIGHQVRWDLASRLPRGSKPESVAAQGVTRCLTAYTTTELAALWQVAFPDRTTPAAVTPDVALKSALAEYHQVLRPRTDVEQHLGGIADACLYDTVRMLLDVHEPATAIAAAHIETSQGLA